MFSSENIAPPDLSVNQRLYSPLTHYDNVRVVAKINVRLDGEREWGIRYTEDIEIVALFQVFQALRATAHSQHLLSSTTENQSSARKPHQPILIWSTGYSRFLNFEWTIEEMFAESEEQFCPSVEYGREEPISGHLPFQAHFLCYPPGFRFLLHSSDQTIPQAAAEMNGRQNLQLSYTIDRL